MLTRLIDELLPGIQVPPSEIMLMGDSQCTIACVEADNRVLDIWFSNRVAEVQDRMESWKRKDIKVNPLHHWPGESNVADLGTKGRAGAQDVIQGSAWQEGPKPTRYPVEEWPISRDFVREIPEEEKRASPYINHGSLSLLGDVRQKNYVFKGQQKQPVMACDMGAELNNYVSRHVPDLGMAQHEEDCLTEKCEDAQPLHLKRRPAQGQLTSLRRNRDFQPENVLRLREILNSVMLYTNKYEKARRIVARILAAHKKSTPVGGEKMKEALQAEPTVNLLNKARDLMFMVSSWEVTPLVPKLENLGPVYNKGVWTCKGRLGKVIKSLLGKENLPILHSKGRLAELLMIQAHSRNHEGVAGTLAASRAHVWILKGRYLARKIVQACVYCRAKHSKLQTQQMGALPAERLSMGSRPFQSVCLDLLGPTLVRAMTNKRATMKVWPIIFVCQSTGAVHAEVMHDYGTQAFLLQWSRFTAVRGVPGVVVSDCGSQLKTVKNTVAYPEAQDPKNWNWGEVEAEGARVGTSWEFVPPGAQFRNGLAERRVAALKSTLNHLMANTIIAEKPTLQYAELQVLLSRAANVVNDRPIGVRSLTEDELVPLTVNQLLLGRTAAVEPPQIEVNPEGYVAADQYIKELMTVWWKLWRQRALPHLLPYYKWETQKPSASRHLHAPV